MLGNRGWLLVSCILAGLTTPGCALAQESRAQTPEVRTVATGERSVRPDLATVKLEFTADGQTPLEAGRALALRADSLRRALGTLGIPKDSLVSASRWYWWRGRIEARPGSRCVPLPQRTPDGRDCMMVKDTTFRAHDAIEVRMHDLDKIGAVLDTAMAHGIRDISPIQFRATDVTAAQEEALRDATARARRQAEAIASASGAQVGRALSLSTLTDSRGYARATLASVTVDSSPSNSGPGTTVVQPSVPVRMTVYGRWELVSKP